MIAVSWLGTMLLGALQGLTEFLPVSSSGHLALLQQFVDAGEEPVLLDILLHVGTLVPAMWFYRERLRGMLRETLQGQGPVHARTHVRLALLVGLSTVTTAVVGLPFKHKLEEAFSSTFTIGFAFLWTASLLALTDRSKPTEDDDALIPWWKAVVLGVAQAVAIIPGVSRSGMTIATGLLLGLRREAAVEFSFLMLMPAIVGATLLELRHADLEAFAWGPAIVGAVSAGAVGYLSLAALVKLVIRGSLRPFSIYLVFAAMFAFWLSY